MTNLGYASSAGKVLCVLLTIIYQEVKIVICPIIDKVNFDQLFILVYTEFLYCKVSLFCVLISVLWEGILIPYKYLASHQSLAYSFASIDDSCLK